MDYIAALSSLGLSATYDKFASVRASVALLLHTRPYLCCAINHAAQAIPKSYCKRHVLELNGSSHSQVVLQAAYTAAQWLSSALRTQAIGQCCTVLSDVGRYG